MVVDTLYLTALLESGEMVVDLINQFVVSADDMHLTDRNVGIAKHQLVEVHLSDFPFQRFLTPHKILMIAGDDTREGYPGRLKFNLTGTERVALDEIFHRIVAGFEHGSMLFQHRLCDKLHRVAFEHSDTDAVIVDDILRREIRSTCVAPSTGEDEVGLSTLEGSDGVTPFFHDKTVG